MRSLLLLPLLACAALAEAPRAEIVGPAGAPRALPVYTATAGESFRFEVSVEAPLGSTVDLHASAQYLTQGLLAPLPAQWPLANDIAFTDATRKIITVEMPTPPLTGPATLQVGLHTVGEAPPSARFLLHLVPAAEKEALSRTLAAALEKHRVHLALYGESPNLRHFFKEYGIEAKDLGTLRPALLPAQTLVLSEDTPPPRGEAIRGRLLLFHPAADRPLPGVYQQASTEGRVTLVTLPVFPPRPASLLIQLLCEELP